MRKIYLITMPIILLSMVFIGGCSLEKGDEQSFDKNQKIQQVGGECEYDIEKGICHVTNIKERQDKLYGGYDVSFMFFDKNGITKISRVTRPINDLNIDCIYNQKDSIKNLAKCDVKEDKKFDCEVKQIKSGTCTPQIIKVNKPIDGNWVNTTTLINKSFAEMDVPGSDTKRSYGTVDVVGYLVIKKSVCRRMVTCDSESEKVDYASLILTEEPTNKEFSKYLDYNENTTSSLGLGCFDSVSSTISSYNRGRGEYSDTYDSYDNYISGEEMKKLLNSSKSSPVKVRVTIPVSGLGKGIPSCYSGLRYIKVY